MPAPCPCGSRPPRWGARRSLRTPTTTLTRSVGGWRRRGMGAGAGVRTEKVGYKVREHSLAKVPVIAVVGRREAEEATVALRRLGSQAQEVVTLDEAIAALVTEATPPDLR